MATAAKPRKSPSQKRSKFTVEVILDAVAHILVGEGYAKLTTNKVARLAGVSIGSLYQYFPNKEALILALYQRHQARVREAMSGQFDATGMSLDTERVKAIIRSVIRAHSIEPQLHARFQALRADGGFHDVLANAGFDQIVAQLEELLLSSKAISKPQANRSAWLLVTAVHALVHAFEEEGRADDEEAQVEEISRLVSGYVAALAEG